jgi:hypothetical protein
MVISHRSSSPIQILPYLFAAISFCTEHKSYKHSKYDGDDPFDEIYDYRMDPIYLLPDLPTKKCKKPPQNKCHPSKNIKKQMRQRYARHRDQKQTEQRDEEYIMKWLSYSEIQPTACCDSDSMVNTDEIPAPVKAKCTFKMDKSKFKINNAKTKARFEAEKARYKEEILNHEVEIADFNAEKAYDLAKEADDLAKDREFLAEEAKYFAKLYYEQTKKIQTAAVKACEYVKYVSECTDFATHPRYGDYLIKIQIKAETLVSLIVDAAERNNFAQFEAKKARNKAGKANCNAVEARNNADKADRNAYRTHMIIGLAAEIRDKEWKLPMSKSFHAY